MVLSIYFNLALSHNCRVAFLFTRATASMFLEKQMQKVDGVLSGFEEQLAKDGVILDKPDALQQRSQQLQVLYFVMNFQDRLIWMPQNLKPLFFLLMPN